MVQFNYDYVFLITLNHNFVKLNRKINENNIYVFKTK